MGAKGKGEGELTMHTMLHRGKFSFWEKGIVATAPPFPGKMGA
jgi:hypothetical protein